MTKLKVCVVGCGSAGLVTIKELLDEGHQVICYEKDSDEGGNFKASSASYDSLRLTISQKAMCFSSFPASTLEPPLYWTRRQYLDYLKRFAQHFNLFEHIKFNSEVLEITHHSFKEFQVVYSNSTGTYTETFDAIAICQGAHRPVSPRMPTLIGAEKFSGKILHSAQYSDPIPFKGKKVVCVGFGETAADVASEIASVADECWATFRRWPSLAMRWDASGFTGDAFSIRASQKVPAKIRNSMVREMTKISAKSRIPQVKLVAQWNLNCKHHIHKFLQKNDDFVPRVLDGTLKIHPCAIKELTQSSIVFEDGKEIVADVIMCCTGYNESAPPDLIRGVSIDNVRDLYKHSILPNSRSRVAFIGWARPAQGGVPACSELQARYFSLLCSEKLYLPEPESLAKLIESDRKVEEEDYFMQPYMKTLVNYCVYLDKMALLIGCLPTIKDLWKHPTLLIRFLFGSNIPSWYRVVGPHANRKQALEQIYHLSIPFSVRRAIKFSWLNFKLWLNHKRMGSKAEYSPFQ